MVSTEPQKPTLKAYEISMADAKLWHQQQDATFLDGRSTLSFNKGHIQGSYSAPHVDVHNNKQILALPRDTRIVTYCNHEKCPIGHILREKLITMGFTDVYVFPGGMREWRAMDAPIGKSLLFSN